MNLEHFRREYLSGGLLHADLQDDALAQFEQWMGQALETEIKDPTAMVLATVNDQGQPSQRIVLLKDIDDGGFVFYTNYGSKKAKEMQHNTQVSLLFPWHVLDRQVKICGRVEKVSAAQSMRYFLTRPRDSQLAAWASTQSDIIPSRQFLLGQLEHMKKKFADGKIPLPDFWGGYRVVPHSIEFWQGGANRLHDRFQYTLIRPGEWVIKRVAP